VLHGLTDVLDELLVRSGSLALLALLGAAGVLFPLALGALADVPRALLHVAPELPGALSELSGAVALGAHGSIRAFGAAIPLTTESEREYGQQNPLGHVFPSLLTRSLFETRLALSNPRTPGRSAPGDL